MILLTSLSMAKKLQVGFAWIGSHCGCGPTHFIYPWNHSCDKELWSAGWSSQLFVSAEVLGKRL